MKRGRAGAEQELGSHFSMGAPAEAGEALGGSDAPLGVVWNVLALEVPLRIPVAVRIPGPADGWNSFSQQTSTAVV